MEAATVWRLFIDTLRKIKSSSRQILDRNIPRGESGCSPDVRGQGVPGTVVDDQAIRACGFGPADRRVSGIEEKTLTSLLTRSGTVLRSWRVCRLEVLGKDCSLSKTGS
jgi:hypothetical protein